MARARLLPLLLVAPALLVGCSDDGADREDGAIKKAGKISVFDVAVGDCLLPDDELGAEISDIQAVPCDDPHTHEVFALPEFETEDGLYPGEEELRSFANAQCLESFGNYTGQDYLESKLFFSYLQPSIRSWNDGDDRRVVCVVVATGEPVTGSVRKAGGSTETTEAGDEAEGEREKSRAERGIESRIEGEIKREGRERLSR